MTSSAVVNANSGSITNLSTINTKTANDLVTSAANGSANMVVTYADTSKVVQSSGTLITDLATTAALTAGLALKVAKSGDSMSGTLNMATNNISNVGSLSDSTNTRTADNILSCTTNPTYGNLPMWSIVNKVFDDSAISSFNVVTGPASAVNNNLCSFNLTSGKIIKDSAIASTNVFKVDGTVSMTGVFTQSNTTDASSTTVASVKTAGGLGVVKKAFIGDTLDVTAAGSSSGFSTNPIAKFWGGLRNSN